MGTDVLVVGAGPVGLTLALLLAQGGLSVELLERRREPWSVPRAVALDDEGLRILQGCGMADAVAEDCAGGVEGQVVCTYLDARGSVVLRVRQRRSELGHPHAACIHQGRIEARLMAAVRRHPRIRTHLGCRVERLAESEGGVVAHAHRDSGDSHVVHATWAIGCDGAESAVRRELGVGWVAHEWPRPWLVANLLDRGPPGHVTIRCGGEGAAVTLPIPHGFRRVEVELPCGDDGSWLADEGEVRRRLLRGWSGADTAPIVGAAVCRFRTAVAARWRAGRAFLAGDAAHLMPPFAGQGLGAGLRDAANLAFKLAGVVQGWLGPEVLDTYELERRPHLERMSRLACRLGRVMSPRSPAEGALLHAAMRVLGAVPGLRDRWLLRGPEIQQTLDRGFLGPGRRAGRYLPQPTVVTDASRSVPLDDLLGPRMTWLILEGRRRRAGPRLDPALLQPTDTVLVEGRDFTDPHGLLRRCFGAGSMVLVRPDRIVHTHISASHPSARRHRSPACRTDIIASRAVRAVAPIPAPSPPSHSRPPSADAWRTARIPAS